MNMLEFISVSEAARKWGISKRHIQKLCEEKRIEGVVKFSRMWLIPKDAEKPADARMKAYSTIFLSFGEKICKSG
jgi:excisionase family DNA binding protein